jgi:Fe2+ transport system protein FeoA
MQKLFKLNEFDIGDSAEVVSVEGSSDLRFRLLEMGIVRGTALSLVRVAPLGDPLVISVQGFQLSLRKEEAALILVRKINGFRKQRLP